jgi:hypothetical protein
MNCPRCGQVIEEQNASFCPHCGGPLDVPSTDLPFERAPLPAQPIHDAPTRISTSSPPGGRRGWANTAGSPPGTPATNADSYGSDHPAPQPLPGATFRRLRVLQEPTSPRRTQGGRIILAILVMLIVFASGVGVGVLVEKLQSQQTPAASKTTAPTRRPSPTATLVERVIFSDPLTAPTNPWQNDSTRCAFRGGSYHILADFMCMAPIGVQSDVAISVQVRQVTGTVRALFGISLRFSSTGNFYAFLLTSNSTWLFEKAVHGATQAIVAETANPAIHPGLNTLNTVLVRVKGTRFDFFFNGTSVGEVNDTTFSSGLVGLLGSKDDDVAFNNFQVATLLSREKMGQAFGQALCSPPG